MIIDCHGHYTTAPKPFREYRQRQIQSLKDASLNPVTAPKISDDQIRETLENAQLTAQHERGTDCTIFSPGAGQMGHHIGNAETSETWSRASNELIHRVCTVFPKNFVGV